jgi:drug/metabolite transporter (DMT)-like permease
LFGIIIVVTGASLTALVALHFSLGDLLILIGNICWAAYSVIGRKFLKGSTPLQTSAVTMVIGAVLFITLAQFNSEANAPFYEQSGAVIGAVLFMALLGTVLAYFWWNNGIAKIGAAKTAVFFDLVPIWTMLLAVLFGQTVTSVQVGGSVLVVSGVLLSSGIQLFPARSQSSTSSALPVTASVAGAAVAKK